MDDDYRLSKYSHISGEASSTSMENKSIQSDTNSTTQVLVREPSSRRKLKQPRLKMQKRPRVVCCLCWCYCFRCGSSCSSSCNKRSKNYRPPSIKERFCRADILEWATSFDSLIKSKYGFRVFEEFLKTEYSDNNLSFWVSVEEFREEKEDILITEMAQDIYETYISSLSPNEVNIDYRTKVSIEEQLPAATNVIFDHAQRQIYYLMYRDCYPRFLASSMYKSLL